MGAFRALFGDESLNYVQALQDHYARGAPADWAEAYVSAYATAHPWEDFAETFAHYLHIVDTVETASTFELHVRPRLRHARPAPTVIDFDPYDTQDLDRLIEAWLPLTYAINSLSHSMGQPALYPFKLTPTVIAKLAFVHERIYASSSGTLPDPGEAGAEMLRAVILGLRQKVAAPTV